MKIEKKLIACSAIAMMVGGASIVPMLFLMSGPAKAENYGWGMRNPDDIIWVYGSRREIPASRMQLQNSLETHGLRLDIVYDDPAYPATGK